MRHFYRLTYERTAAILMSMLQKQKEVPPHIPLGKAKAMDSVILTGGIRLYKKARVRFWIERRGALENYYIIHGEKIYYLSAHEFKTRFKVIIKSGAVKLPTPDDEPSTAPSPSSLL